MSHCGLSCVRVRQEVMDIVRAADSLIFDVDGVLVDVSRSIRMVNVETVRIYLNQVLGWPACEPGSSYYEPGDVDELKQTIGFNDDWAVTKGLILLCLAKAQRYGTKEAPRLRSLPPTVKELAQELRRSRRGYEGLVEMALSGLNEDVRRTALASWDDRTIVELFQEVYAGEENVRRFYGREAKHYRGPGLFRFERPILDPRKLAPAAGGCASSAKASWKMGLYTGRLWGETVAALELVGADHAFERAHAVVADDGILKPDPRGLRQVAAALRSRAAIFLGDRPDDSEAVRRYRESASAQDPPVLGCMVLYEPTNRADVEDLEGGIDLIAPDVNALLDWLMEKQS
jgi:HAD superfamily hydrolase (TIGR01548 family)